MLVEIIIFAVGVIVGCIVMALLSRRKAIGDLCIDDYGVDCVPYLALKDSTDLELVKYEQYIMLRVVDLSRDSQK